MSAAPRWIPRAGAVLACSLLLILIAAPQADAKRIRYTGKTEQGMDVSLQTDAKGKPERFAIHYDAKCRNGKVSDATSIYATPFTRVSTQGFADRGTFQHRYHSKFVQLGKFRYDIVGNRVSDTRFRGTFDLKVRYYDNGHRIDLCHARSIRWSVHR